jgi:hypothetical protein
MSEALNLYKCTSHRAYDYFARWASECTLTHYKIVRDEWEIKTLNVANPLRNWTVGGCSTYFIHVEGTLPNQALQYAKPYTVRKGFTASPCW